MFYWLRNGYRKDVIRMIKHQVDNSVKVKDILIRQIDYFQRKDKYTDYIKCRHTNIFKVMEWLMVLDSYFNKKINPDG